MKHKIIDNFLNKEDYDLIYKTIMSFDNFAWYCTHDHVASMLEPGDGMAFYHMLLNNGKETSPFSKTILGTLFKKIKIKYFLRAKVNMYCNTNTIHEHGMHTDLRIKHKGLIFYLNTNDGYTKLKDGTKINSIENRVLLFDSSKKHCSTTCTNTKSRININVNYL